MTTPTLTMSEIAERDLRSAIAEVDRNLTALASDDAGSRSQPMDAVAGSWRRVVALLKLGPEPERRDCPWCQGPMRLLATRCVHCWRKSDSSE